MPHRMDVELTSRRDDATWTWRAAGAKEPRGIVDAALLPEGARVGDVVRVEATFDVDGISVSSVLPTRDKARSEPQRVEVLGPPSEPRPPDDAPARPGDRRQRRPAPGERGDRRARPERSDRRPGPARRDRSQGPRPDRKDDRGRKSRQGDGPAAPARERQRKFTPGHAHRSAALAELPPEQRPVAEQVLRGGIPAVRQAVEAQNARLRQEGKPEVRGEPLVALAEQLLPRLRTAEWRDRAEAAAAAVDEVPLRDLRFVVAGADAAARDDETRLLASNLRQALERRLEDQRKQWLAETTAALDEGRLVRALRLSARPPDPGTRFPAELAMRLSEEAGRGLASDVAPDRWVALLEAVAESPVRRTVKPAGLPAEAGEELRRAARQACGRVPALAPMLGIDMPPPPAPPRAGPRLSRGRSRTGGASS